LSRQDSLRPLFPAFRLEVGDASRCAWTERNEIWRIAPAKGDIPNGNARTFASGKPS
jgi:hypothetical protein